MAGRHVDASMRRPLRRRRTVLLVTAVVALVALVAGAGLYFFWPASTSAAGSGGGSGGGQCTSGVSVDVVTAPSIAPTVRAIASRWQQSRPDLGGACPTVTVRSAGSAAEVATLAQPDVTVPDVWIPDSSVWVQRLRTQTLGSDTPVRSLWLYPPVATSPLVLTSSQPRAATLGASAKTWTSALDQAPGVAMTNPATDTAGLLTVLTAQSLLEGKSGTPSRELVSALVRLSRATVPTASAAFVALHDHPTTAAAFPTSEQAVLAANRSISGLKAVAVYPTGKAMSLDYPVAQFARPGGDPGRRDAATALVAALQTPDARQQLAASGFRDPAGHPLSAGDATTAVRAVPVAAVERPASDQVADGLRVWAAARRGNRTLAVIDLSGSMADSAGGQSKIRFAANAARSAVDFFPDTSSLGLWGFSANRPGGHDWSELVSLGPLGSRTGSLVRRTKLLRATAALPHQTGGSTGLYATTIAAFEKVRSGWDPGVVNSVVLLTDGANTDRSGIGLAGLLSRLRSETSSARPLPIITIAIGPDADVTTLKRISAATRGRTYTVANPADIRSAFLDALVSAG